MVPYDANDGYKGIAFMLYVLQARRSAAHHLRVVFDVWLGNLANNRGLQRNP